MVCRVDQDVADAGSDDSLNVTINVDGIDLVDDNVAWRMKRAETYFIETSLFDPFDTGILTNSSIRWVFAGAIAGCPSTCCSLATHSGRPFRWRSRDIDTALSTDADEGHLMPLRCRAGSSTT